MHFLPLILAIPLVTALPACGNGKRCEGTDTPVDTPIEVQSIEPTCTHLYGVKDGSVQCADDNQGRIYKRSWNDGADLTTLTTFHYTADMQGKTCQFGFELDDTSTVEGSGLVDLFSTFHSIDHCPTKWWNPNNGRNQHLGRLEVNKPGKSDWVYQYLPVANEFECKPEGTEENLELVGVYDDDEIVWNLGTTGARIYYWS